MLRIYRHYKYVNSYIAGIDFRRQNLTSTDVYRRLKSIPALKRLDSSLTIIYQVTYFESNI